MKKITLFLSCIPFVLIFLTAPKAHAIFNYYQHDEPYIVDATPPPANSVSLTANPTLITVPTDPNETTLRWTISGTDVTGCSASSTGPSVTTWTGSVSANQGLNGPFLVQNLVVGNYVFDITCTVTNSAPISDQALVVVQQDPATAVTVSLLANGAPTTTIPLGSSATLTWTSNNAVSCTSTDFATGGATSNTSPGVSVSPLITTQYNITCTDNSSPTPQSATASATVIVDTNPDNPTISYFTPFSCVSDTARSPRFAWGTLGVNACTITRTTAPQIDQDVAISSQAAGGTLEADGLYYFLSSLPVVGSSSNYKLQCTDGVQVVEEYAAVNVCMPDFALSAVPAVKSFVNGTNPGTGNLGKVATYTISVSPYSGFTRDVALSIASSPNMPASTTFTFTPGTLSATNGVYNTATLVVGIDLTDFPPTSSNTVYTPIVIQGVGGGITHTATVSADATGKKRPIYLER